MKDRITMKVWNRALDKNKTFDLYFSNLEDAHSFSRYWATVEGQEITDLPSCRFKVIPNYTGGTRTHPHSLNHYPPKEVVEAWMAIFEEDQSC